MDFLKKNKAGLTMIELLVVVMILAIFILMAFFAFKIQLMKGRDARRKADLAKLQKTLEDVLNDKICYPDELVCDADFAPYLPKIPCDPLNNTYYNYFYSFDGTKSCKNWYKIYTKLENEKDPIIAKVGCASGCGPSNNYNYWVGSPNVTEVTQLPGEDWPSLPAGTSPTPTPTPLGGPLPTGTPTPTPTPTGSAVLPSEASPTPTPTPAGCSEGLQPTCWGGSAYYCLPNVCSSCCPGVEYQCNNEGNCCFYNPTDCHL